MNPRCGADCFLWKVTNRFILGKILLISAYQIVVQDRTSVGAVVSETVSEIKKKEGEAPAKFANACLRKISEYRERFRALNPAHGQGKEQAAWASMPEWLWGRLVQQKGLEWASAYAVASLSRPLLWVRGKNSEWNPDWAEKGPIQNSWCAQPSGAIDQLSGFQEGQFLVQDISSQYLISELTQMIPAGSRVIDLCAAPGGKSVGLAWNGFQVEATDKNETRLSTLRQSVAKLAPEVKVTEWSRIWETAAPFEAEMVWIDAPCSSTGILRRHPDVRWLRKEKDIASLNEAQTELVQKVWQRMKPGAFMVYSVCSVLEEEGPLLFKKLGLDVVKSWSLSPQESPNGDGFWAGVVRK